MNSVQMHLALTHVPVILSLTGFVMLVAAIILRKNATLFKASYIFIAIAGLTALPVYFTGEDAEEVVEKITGISETLIERHEEVAKFSMISIIVAGMVAIASLLVTRFHEITRYLKPVVFIMTIISTALMIQTAHLGGQIRHTEITNGSFFPETGGAENNAGTNDSNDEQDDD